VDIEGVGDTLPSSALTSTTGLAYTWAASTTNAVAPQNLGGTGRVAAEWYGQPSLDFDLNLTDGAEHQVALYVLDYDGQNRTESVQVLNASTQAVLASETVSSFTGGDYVVFDVTGNVIFRITKVSGGSAALTGVFLDSATASPNAVAADQIATVSPDAVAAAQIATSSVFASGITPQAATVETTKKKPAHKSPVDSHVEAIVKPKKPQHDTQPKVEHAVKRQEPKPVHIKHPKKKSEL